ncbi:hypothetical protein PLICRDRAFT_462403 [Plicaturopsis crispa FD-325 SS-3]|nr:hypothetical protein PLICRDRAFT_462403 [Plicaturopsis crispa FD-325 SS-3]
MSASNIDFCIFASLPFSLSVLFCPSSSSKPTWAKHDRVGRSSYGDCVRCRRRQTRFSTTARAYVLFSLFMGTGRHYKLVDDLHMCTALRTIQRTPALLGTSRRAAVRGPFVPVSSTILFDLKNDRLPTLQNKKWSLKTWNHGDRHVMCDTTMRDGRCSCCDVVVSLGPS